MLTNDERNLHCCTIEMPASVLKIMTEAQRETILAKAPNSKRISLACDSWTQGITILQNGGQIYGLILPDGGMHT